MHFGRIHVTISGAKEATQKNNQNEPWSKAARPDPASPKPTQDDRTGNQQAKKRKAPKVGTQSARAAAEKRNTSSNEKTRMKKRMFPQMLENKAPEHPKCPPKSSCRFLVDYKPRLKMQASQHSKKRGRISRERTAPEYGSHHFPRLKITFLAKNRQMLKNKAPESK